MNRNKFKFNEAKLNYLIKEAVQDAIDDITNETDSQENLFWQIEPEIENLLKSKFPTRQELQDPEHPDRPFIDEFGKGEWRIWNPDLSEALDIEMHMKF